jgi:hypothetical protein
MLYGHPTKELGLHPNVLDFIFKYVKTLPNLWISSLDKFFKWWSLRENAAVSAHLDAGNLNFQVKNIFPHLCIRIVLPDDRELIVPAEEESKISLTRAHIESKPFKTASIDDFEPHLSQIRLSKRIIHFFVMKVKRILGKAD